MAQHSENSEKIPAQTKEIWRTFWILLGITALEFLIAFVVDADTYKWTKVGIFIILTIVKKEEEKALYRELKRLQSENRELKSLVADKELAIQIKDSLLKKFKFLYS